MSLEAELEELYRNYWKVHATMFEEYEPMEVAAVLTTQALSIYKTCLPPDDFDAMVDSISNMRDNVQILNFPGINYKD